MDFPAFRQYLDMREGVLLPDRPPAKGLSRINPIRFSYRGFTGSLAAAQTAYERLCLPLQSLFQMATPVQC